MSSSTKGTAPGFDWPTYVANFQRRVIQDALVEATAAYWLHRAETFDAVGTPECDEVARACRNAATLAPLQAEDGGWFA